MHWYRYYHNHWCSYTMTATGIVTMTTTGIENITESARIRVRIGPLHPLASRKRRLNGGVPSDETGKTEEPCRSECGTIKIPPNSKALSAEHTPKFCIPPPAMGTSPYK
jgi:hypothetical protein